MTSAELRSQKSDFIASVNAFVGSLDGINASANSVNSYLTSTEDTILNNEIFSHSENISTVAAKAKADVTSKMNSILVQVDNEIARKEEEERQARLKAQQDDEDSNGGE